MMRLQFAAMTRRKVVALEKYNMLALYQQKRFSECFILRVKKESINDTVN
jgi:hypothetical protein